MLHLILPFSSLWEKTGLCECDHCTVVNAAIYEGLLSLAHKFQTVNSTYCY